MTKRKCDAGSCSQNVTDDTVALSNSTITLLLHNFFQLQLVDGWFCSHFFKNRCLWSTATALVTNKPDLKSFHNKPTAFIMMNTTTAERLSPALSVLPWLPPHPGVSFWPMEFPRRHSTTDFLHGSSKRSMALTNFFLLFTSLSSSIFSYVSVPCLLSLLVWHSQSVRSSAEGMLCSLYLIFNIFSGPRSQ